MDLMLSINSTACDPYSAPVKRGCEMTSPYRNGDECTIALISANDMRGICCPLSVLYICSTGNTIWLAHRATMLPLDTDHQPYVTVRPIIGGSLELPYYLVYQDCIDHPRSNYRTVPSLCFLITHPTSGHILFDLGIRKVSLNTSSAISEDGISSTDVEQNAAGYPPSLNARVHDFFHARCERDVADTLRTGGVQPEDVRTIILRYVLELG